MTKKKELPKRPYEDAEYIGNVWGWKFSMISAVFIGSMLLLAVFLYSRVDEKTMKEWQENQEAVMDSLSRSF